MATKKICLDAGHYGKYNQSPVNKSYYESDMTWKLHKYLKTELEAFGFKVIVTRTDKNKDLALESRGKKAKGCDLFLSLHSNAASSKTADYAVACCMIDDSRTMIDDISEALGKKLAAIVNTTMGSKGKWKIWEREGNNNADYYGVLRGAKSVGVPGILLEHGFHTNKNNTAWLLKDANLKKLAQAEAKVIADYFGVKKSTTKPATTTKPTTTTSTFKSYKVKVICDALNIRKTPKWGDADVVGVITDKGTYTIVGEKMLGTTKFGKLKSGAGYISLGAKYVKRV